MKIRQKAIIFTKVLDCGSRIDRHDPTKGTRQRCKYELHKTWYGRDNRQIHQMVEEEKGPLVVGAIDLHLSRIRAIPNGETDV